MRIAVAALTVLTAAACGGSSGDQQLAVSPPQPSQPTLQDASAVPAPSAAASPSDARYSSAPVTAETNPSAAYAGTASSGPGRLSSPPTSPSPPPTPTAVAGTVTVTDNDSGSTVRLQVGQRLRVRLSSGTWDPPVSSSESVLVRRTNKGGYPSDQPVDAMFDALSSGSADVTAQSDAACFHTEPRCMMASRQWQVHVVVG